MSLTLVRVPLPSRTSELEDLAHAACAALAADAAVVLQRRPDGGLVLVGATGADDEQLGAVCAAAGSVHRAVGARGPWSVPGFPMVVAGESRLTGAPSVVVWAMRRTGVPFDSPGLAIAFARHAALALVGEREPLLEAPPGALEYDVLRARLVEGLGEAELVAVAREQLAVRLGPVDVGVRIFDDESGQLQVVAGSRTTEPDISGQAHGVDWESCVARVFATGRPYLTNAADSDPGVLQGGGMPSGVRRLLVVPLAVGARRVGVLELAGPQRDLRPEDLRHAERLAPDLAVAAAVAHHRSRLERRLRFEEVLGACAQAVAAGRNLQEFLGDVLKDVCEAAATALVALVPRSGEPVLWRRDGRVSPLERVFLGEARGAGAPRTYTIPARRAGGRGWAALHLPVQDSDGERLATLSVLREEARSFDADERRAFERLAGLVALAWATEGYQLRRAEMARRAERQRIGDALHDDVAQLLFAARLRLDSALEAPRPANAAAEAERARELVLRADGAVRGVVQACAEQGRDDLEQLLAAVASAVEDEFGRAVQLELAPEALASGERLSRSAVSLLAKAAREALVNAAKHAGPCQLSLRLRLTARGRLLLAVSDDGLGIGSGGRKGHGLTALRRAVAREGGVLRVRRPQAGGTTMTVTLAV